MSHGQNQSSIIGVRVLRKALKKIIPYFLYGQVTVLSVEAY